MLKKEGRIAVYDILRDSVCERSCKKADMGHHIIAMHEFSITKKLIFQLSVAILLLIVLSQYLIFQPSKVCHSSERWLEVLKADLYSSASKNPED